MVALDDAELLDWGIEQRGARRDPIYPLLERAMESPGQWWLLKTWPGPSRRGEALVSELRRGRRAVPAGEWEFAWRRTPDGGTATLVKYNGPETGGR